MLPFDQAEYDARIARTRARMAEAGIDVLIVSNEASQYYLTGYDAVSAYVPQCVVLATDGVPEIILRSMDVACARHTVWMDHNHIHEYAESFIGYPGRNGWDHIATLLESMGHGRRRIGYEGDSAEQIRTLEARLPNAKFVHVGELMNRVRGLKSDREIEYMQLAGQIADRAMQAGIDAIEPGVRECDVAAIISAAQVAGLPDAGGSRIHPMSMPSGKRTDSPHLIWTDKRYEHGDAVNIELGGSHLRYVCGLTRSIHLGPPPDRLRALHSATLEGMEAVFALARPGVLCEEIEAVFRKTTTKYGFLKPSRIGYAIGIDWTETWASLHAGDRTVLQPNMTFHLMLGMWEYEWGVALSEAFRITPTGAESFSHLSRELFVKA